MRTTVFTITALIQLAVAFFGFFILLLGLNGFHESDATPSLIFYIALAVISALGLGAASAYTAKRLTEKTSLGKVAVLAIALLGFAIVGVLILFVGLIAAAFLAEAVRTWT